EGGATRPAKRRPHRGRLQKPINAIPYHTASRVWPPTGLWYRGGGSPSRGERTMTPTEPRIRKTPGVIVGDACVRNTRIDVWMLVEWKKLGRTDADLLADFPDLTPEDLEAAWAYYTVHPDEIETAIRENNEAG